MRLIVSEKGSVGQVKSVWNLNFILIWLGYLVSSIGDHLNAIAFSVLVLEKTDSIFQMGIVMTTNFIPLMVGSIIAGPFVDRFSAKKIMIYADVIRGIALIAFVVYDQFYAAGIIEICIVAAINGFAQSWFAPASQSILRLVVAQDQFVKANSYYQVTGQGTEILVKGLSGFALVLVGPIGLLLLDGISFLLSGLSEMFVKIESENHINSKFSYFENLKQGFDYLTGSPEIVFTIIGVGILNFFAIPGYVLLIPYFKKESSLGMPLYGLFMSMLASGMILGGFLCSKFKKEWHYILIFTATISLNLTYIVFSFVDKKWAVLTSGFVLGMCFAFGRILFNSVILANTKQEFVGRIFSIIGFSSGILSPISMILSAYLGERFQIREVIRYGYILSAIATLILLVQPKFYLAFKYRASPSG